MSASRCLRLAPAILMVVAMIAAPALAKVLKPGIRMADQGARVLLETMLPKEFGGWRGVPASQAIVANPRSAETLNRIYTQTLSRTYVNPRGRQVMLSVAYGADQRDGMEVHYPEVCYPAQGFHLISADQGMLTTPFGSLRVKRLQTVQGQRREPITYWTMVGDHQTFGGTEKKLIEIRYALAGLIPDGLLFRVSSVAEDSAAAYREQDQFIAQLLAAMSPPGRKRLSGL